MSKIVYDCRWSHEITPEFMADFLFVLNKIWTTETTENQFEIRYKKNIYGKSLLMIAYVDGKPAATQAFWRNDINDRKAYQSGDSAVLEQYRGKGIFKEMVKRGTELLGDDILIYGFPNNNSTPTFIKLGYDMLCSHVIRLFYNAKRFSRLCPQEIDFNYAQWYLSKSRRIFYVKRHSCYFLVVPTSRRYVYQIISSCDKHTALLFEKGKNCSLLVYAPQSNVISNEKKGNIIVMGYKGEYIPLWKCDAV